MNYDITALMAFLAPCKTVEFLDELKLEIKNNSFNWEALLYQANLHLCTPLWYVQLKKDGLLELLPEDLAEYLYYMYELSLERHEQFRDALEEILHLFNEHAIETLLLKGAATFCDDLFAPGTRVMGDLDILVPPEKVALCQELIISLGYQPMHGEELTDNSMPSDIRQHHIARHVKVGTPIVVEIHFRISQGLSGRIFNLNEVWSQSIPVEFRGCKSSILCPKHRILLNTVHAMLPSREYLSGHISALQWVEFVLLAERYSSSFDWNEWILIAQKNGLENMFKLYFYFSVQFLQMNGDESFTFKGNYLKFNVNRLLIISQYQNNHIQPNFFKRNILLFFKFGYYIGLAQWLWDNQCYSNKMTGTIERVQFCFKKLFSKESRKAYWY